MEPIRSIFEDDPDILEIVQEFAAELPDRVAEIQASLASGESSGLQTIAHQLKGAGGGYGFQQITDSAAALEHAVKQGESESIIKEKCDELCAILGAVVVPK